MFFLDVSDKCMNCESTKVGLYLPVSQQYLFMNCIDCQREEDEYHKYKLTCL